MRFLTINFYTSKETNLWKDNGGIPYALAKYYRYKSRYVYLNKYGITKNAEYEKYVELDAIDSGNNTFINYFNILKYICKNIKEFDVLNFYALGIIGILASKLAKVINPNIIVYNKLDMGRYIFIELTKNNNIKRKIKNFLLGELTNCIDIYTVETQKYIEPLNKLKRFKNKIKYLPNGYFDDLVEINENIKKEKIILTVGRLGTVEKNTEMLVETIENIEPEKLKGWKIYLVGSMTEKFKEWFNDRLNAKPYLQNHFVVTGNITDKKELYTLYAKSCVFVLPSRWESWGLVLTEAAAFACYPIVTDCCDAFYEMLDSANGSFSKIIPQEDKNALRNAIEDVLDNKIDYISNGIKAHEFVSENFDWKIVVRNLDNYLNELQGKKKNVKRI